VKLEFDWKEKKTFSFQWEWTDWLMAIIAALTVSGGTMYISALIERLPH